MLKEIIIAFQSFIDAHRFISKNRLWKWIIIPGIIYTIMFLAGVYFFWISANTLIQEILTGTGLKQWLESMEEGLLTFFVIVGQVIIWLVLLFLYFSLFKFLFLIVGSPIFAYLSEKTEAIIEGKDFPFSWKEFFKDIIRAIKIAGRNILWQTVYMVSIFLLSFIPLFGWIAPLISMLVECYYFGFSMLDYSCERNKLSTAQSIRFIGSHKGLAIGNGMMFFAMHLIPVIGWLLAPSYAVVAATLSIIKIKNTEAKPVVIPVKALP